jgi:hypothetical protein
MAWQLSDSYGDELADAMAESNKTGDALEGNYWATQEVETIAHKGSDKFRRNFSRITNFIGYMDRLGWINKDQIAILKFMAACTELTYGAILAYAGISTALKSIQAYEAAAASAKTAAHVAAQDYVGIAIAAAITAGIAASFCAGGALAEHQQDIRVNADYTTSSGRMAITNNIRFNKPAVA